METITKAEYARLKGLNKSTITRWVKAGRLVVNEAGAILVAESEARLKETADPTKEGVVARHEEERGERVREASVKPPRDPERDSSYTKRIGESARREAAMADIAELERDKQVGRLVERAQVERALADSIVAARQSLERMPDRLSLPLAAESNPDKIHEMLTAEIHAVCQQIADFVQQLPGPEPATRQ